MGGRGWAPRGSQALQFHSNICLSFLSSLAKSGTHSHGGPRTFTTSFKEGPAADLTGQPSITEAGIGVTLLFYYPRPSLVTRHPE